MQGSERMSSFYDHQSEYIGEHSPIRIEFVETQQHVDELLPALYDMVTDGLITVQDLTAIKAVATDARARPAPLENSKRIVTVSALEGYVETTELHPPHLFQSDLPIVITIV